jgi:sugar lactone lactonase YvrE
MHSLTDRLLVTLAGAVAMAIVLSPETIRGASGDIYEADFATSTIFRFTPAGAKTTFASVSFPLGLAFDAAGNLFCVEKGTNSIVKLTPAGVKTTFATGFTSPGHLAIDTSGNLFVGDGQTIVKITPGGVKSVFATGGFTINPAFDPAGNLFAPQGTSVVKFTPNGTKTTFASGFTNAVAVTFDSGGNTYVLDQNSNSNSIYKFTPAGSKTTFASTVGGGVSLVYNGAGMLYTAGSSKLVAIRLSDASQTIIASGLSGTLKVEPPLGNSVNISTRLKVQTGENVLIGGFIITGSAGKKVLIRGIGPSLSALGIAGLLQDPTIELRNSSGALVNGNNNWKDTQQTAIAATGAAPTDDRESALLITLGPGSWTVIMRGANNTTGIGVVEVYDLDQAADSRLANISTRGFVETGNNILIGGFILGTNGSRVVVRAIGPSLAQAGIAGALPNTTLSLRDGNGTEIAANDDWNDTQAEEVQATGVAPSSSLESAIVATLPNGNYTAIVSGLQGATGVGLVEVYNLR